MAGIALAADDLYRLSIGTTEVQTVSLGSTTLWTAPPPVTVQFDAVSSVSAGTGDQTFSHTATAGATVLVGINQLGDNSMAGVTYAGAAMNHIGSLPMNNSSAEGFVRLYEIDNVAGGTASVVVDKNGSNWIRAFAISFVNVLSIGTPVTQFGTGLSASHSVSAPPTNGMVLQVFAFDANRTITPSGGTNRVNFSNTGGAIAASTATAATTFAASLSGGADWASIAVPLTPDP